MFLRNRSKTCHNIKGLSLLAILFILQCLMLTAFSPVTYAEDSQFFSETSHFINGKFLDYWRSNGGLATFGFPITDAQNETDPETGKTFLTQWFERNRFELHPENAGTKYEVLLGLLGKDLRREALDIDPDFLKAERILNNAQPADQQLYFEETGHNLRFGFLDYWRNNGGLERFGYPISEEHNEIDPETGKAFIMQWFERARFEFHTENPEPFKILLGLLGNQIKTPRTKVDLVWKQGGSFNDLKTPRGVAVDNQGNIYVAETLNNRIQKYDKNGNYLLKWGSTGTNDGQFKFPYQGGSGVVVDGDGNILVADTNNVRIQKFDSNGNFLSKFPVGFDIRGIAIDKQSNIYTTNGFLNKVTKYDKSGNILWSFGTKGSKPGQFDEPVGIGVDDNNEIFISDRFNSRIQKFDAEGHFLLQWGGVGNNDGLFWSLHSLTVDTFGNVYVADGNNARIQKFNNQGKFMLKIGEKGSNPGEFLSPENIAIDSQGNIFVSDYKNGTITRFTSEGKSPFIIGKKVSGDLNLIDPRGIAINSQGEFLIADAGNNKIIRLDNKGRLQSIWGNEGTGDGQFTQIEDIAIDSHNNIFIIDNFRVQKFDKQGNFILKWGNWGEGNGQFGFPVALTIDSQNNVYVLDRHINFIQKFDSTGKFISKWAVNAGSDISVDAQSNIWVTNDERLLQKFNSSGNFLGKWSINGGCISIDRYGNFYIGNFSTITKYDSNLNIITQWGKGEDQADGQATGVTGIAVDDQNSMFVTSSFNYNAFVQKFRQR